MERSREFDIVVVGGGPAGLMAAGWAASAGASTALLEKNPECGKKLLITGSGRCNIAPADTDTRRFIEAFGKPGKFLYPAMNAFSISETLDFFRSLGLSFITEGAKVFPETGGAQAVRDALVSWCAGQRVSIMTGLPASGIDPDAGRVVIGDRAVSARRIILATGGLSYAATGCTGEGLSWAKKIGHRVVPTHPALTPVKVSDPWIGRLEGLSLGDVALHISDGDRRVASAGGDVVFTRDGLSGPAVYRLSRDMAGVDVHGMRLSLNRFPASGRQGLIDDVQSALSRNGKKAVKTVMEGFFPSRMLSVVFELTGIDPMMRAAVAGKNVRDALIDCMDGFAMTVDRFHGYSRATVTAGGITRAEIEPKTMRSKVHGGLYVAGEVIDIDGPTGGYNLQVCWSTGRLAGISAARDVCE